MRDWVGASTPRGREATEGRSPRLRARRCPRLHRQYSISRPRRIGGEQRAADFGQSRLSRADGEGKKNGGAWSAAHPAVTSRSRSIGRCAQEAEEEFPQQRLPKPVPQKNITLDRAAGLLALNWFNSARVKKYAGSGPRRTRPARKWGTNRHPPDDIPGAAAGMGTKKRSN